MERREVRYSGRVQGVGFRFTTSRIAQRHPVEGFVENLANGQVHLVAEGLASSLNAFLTEIDEAMAGNITERLVDKQTATGEFNSFGIRQ